MGIGPDTIAGDLPTDSIHNFNNQKKTSWW